MKKKLTLTLLCLLAIAVAGLTGRVQAQDQPKPADTEKAPRRTGLPPLNGKIKAVDQTAQTLTIGDTTLQITPETKIIKDGKQLTLNDLAVGEEATAIYRKTDDGKLRTLMVRVGPRQIRTEHKPGAKGGTNDIQKPK